MRFHWQNLNEKRHGKLGNPIRNGRAWWYLSERRRIAWEWGIRPRVELGASATSGGMYGSDSHLTMQVCVFGAFFYLMLTFPILARLSKWASRRDGCRVGAEFRWDGTPRLSIDVGSREMSWRSRDPWWKKGLRWDFADILLGRRVYSCEVHSEHDVVIPMPEGCYPAKVKLETCRWKRPRWPFALVRPGSHVDIPGGIPFAGKGENSWDCGDDGLWGSNPAVATVEDAIADIVGSVLKSRRKYGPASFLRDKQPVMASRV